MVGAGGTFEGTWGASDRGQSQGRPLRRVDRALPSIELGASVSLGAV